MLMRANAVIIVVSATFCALGADFKEAATEPISSQSQLIQKGPHHERIEFVSFGADADGTSSQNTNSYVRLETGLNRWDEKAGAYIPASAAIQLVEGFGVVTNTQHKAIFSRQLLDHNGTVDLVTSEGDRLVTQPMGIALTEADTEKSVFLAEAKQSTGILLDETTFVYPDAFDQFQGSVVVRSHLYGVESDVILEERIDRRLLEEFQINPAKARIEVWHRVIQKPQGSREGRNLGRADGVKDEDESFHFRGMSVVRGGAYALGLDRGTGAADALSVAKKWIRIEGADYLIESIPFAEAEEPLRALPRGEQARVIDAKALETAFAAAKDERGRGITVRRKPISVATMAKRETKKDVAVAIIDSKTETSRKGFVIDYTTYSSSLTNHTFRGDTTYWITGDVGLFGSTTLEGGAVVKFTNYTVNTPVIRVYGDFQCNTAPYNPAVFTAEDDDTVGEKIASSTGVPETGTFYSWFNLWFQSSSTNPLSVHDIHSRYSHVGLGFSRPVADDVSNIQIYNCFRGLEPREAGLNARNVLMHKTRYAFNTSLQTNVSILAEHVTVNSAQELLLSLTNAVVTLDLRNSLICNVTNDTDTGIIYSNSFVVPSSVFASVGRGNHYLGDHNYRDVGITNISVQMQALLAQTTTHAPILLTNDFSSDTILQPIIETDTGLPDLGYHYAPIDFLIGELNVTNSTLTLSNGVRVAFYGTNGVVLRNGSKLYSSGRPDALNTLVRYQSVQEDPSTDLGGPKSSLMNLVKVSALSSDPEVRFRFTRANFLTDNVNRRNVVRGFIDSELISNYSLRNCQFYNSYHRHLIETTPGGQGVEFINNLFRFSSIVFYQTNTSGFHEFPLEFRNNTLIDGATTFYYGTSGSTWTVKDNFFNGATQNGTVGTFSASNNAYRSAPPGLGGGTNINLAVTTDYVSGPLGSYYYPSSGTSLYTLVNAGSRTADAAGLYHFTTLATANSKETNSPVDIGFHYISAGSGGSATDSDGDGLGDYFEDTDGDGVVDTGETDFDDPDTDGDGVDDGTEWLQGRNPLVGAVADTNGVINLRVYTPLE